MKLKLGTFLVLDKDFTENSEKYKSRVIDSGEGFVMIDYPTHIETGKTAFFMDGTQLHVSFTDDLKMSYAFETEVSGRLNKGVPMIRLTYPGDDQLVKIQRREFVRIEVAVDVAVTSEGITTQLIGEDISAGGMAITLTKSTLFNEGDTLKLLIVLPFLDGETKYIQATGDIIRVWEKSKRMIASVEFVDVREEDRQRIIRYCFERQLQMRNG